MTYYVEYSTLNLKKFNCHTSVMAYFPLLCLNFMGVWVGAKGIALYVSLSTDKYVESYAFSNSLFVGVLYMPFTNFAIMTRNHQTFGCEAYLCQASSQNMSSF